jgi:hypothetical protein
VAFVGAFSRATCAVIVYDGHVFENNHVDEGEGVLYLQKGGEGGSEDDNWGVGLLTTLGIRSCAHSWTRNNAGVF